MKETSRNNDELTLDQFIDDLIDEKKPAAYRAGEVDPGMEQMFETVRSLRRLKQSNRWKNSPGRNRRWRGFATLAAALLLVALGLSILKLPGIDRTARPGRIVEAAVRAYEELQGYSGVFEIRSEQNGLVGYLETVTIAYQKPGKYVAVHRFDGHQLKYVSDGERMLADESAAVTVENLFPEKELWRYHIGTVIRELAQAEQVEVLAREKIFGRDAELLQYSYPGSGGGEYSQVWIDSKTYLPLRKVFYHPEGSTLVVEFIELTINPQLDQASFAWTLPEGREVVVLNRPGSLEQVKQAWPELENILPALNLDLDLWKAGLLDGDLFEYVLRFRGGTDDHFVDLYYTSAPGEFYYFRDSKVGLLGDGYVELNPGAWNQFERYFGASRTARWVTADWEVVMVTSRGLDYLQYLVEELARDKISFRTIQEMKELGFEPVYEKEGH